MGPEAAEGDRPLEGGEEFVSAVGGFHGAELTEVGGQGGHAAGGGPFDEALGHRTEGAERQFGGCLGPHRPVGGRPCPAVVLVGHRGLTRGDEAMFGDDLAQEHDHDRAVLATRSSTWRPMWSVGTE